MKDTLFSCRPTEYVSAISRGRGGAHMARGSENGMVSGEEFVRAFNGATILEGKSGSKILFNVDQSYAGLGTQATDGEGFVFSVRQLLMAIGAGQVNFDGEEISTFIASSTLSYIKKSGGVYEADTDTGPFQAGRAQPSAPLIFAKDNPSAGQTAMSGGISVVIWRSSDIDGQVSLMSLPSNVLILSGQSVIVQMPEADMNGQTHWGIGVPKVGFDELGNFYMLPTSLGGEVAEADLATIDGIDRAVEISWTNGALAGQAFAPDKAFPPVAAQFAGAMNDVLFLDADGIIYVGEPNYIGSFAPSNTIFCNEPAVHYLRIGAGAYARFGRHSIGILRYVGGRPALEYQEIQSNLGIQLPQNVAIGFGGRLMMWLGKPTVLDTSLEPDFEYAKKVMPDFAGWNEQDETKPIVPHFDPQGLYEIWAFGKKVIARYAPEGRWCSPIDLTGKISGNIMAAIIIPTDEGQKLYLSCVDGADLKLYQFDAGTGSVMVVQTDDTVPGYGDTISEVFVQARVDNADNNIKVEAITDGDDSLIETVFDDLPKIGDDPVINKPFLIREWPNIINAQMHALRVTLTSAGGDAGVDLMATFGEQSGVVMSQ